MKTTFDAAKYISARLGDQDRTNLTRINAVVNEFVMEHLYTLCKEVIALDEVGSFPDAENSKFHELRRLYLTAYNAYNVTHVGVNTVADVVIRAVAKEWLNLQEQENDHG